MDSIKDFIGTKASKKVNFATGKVTIGKLTVEEVDRIQEISKEDSNDLALVKELIKMSVTGGDELTDEEFASLALDDINKLAKEIMNYSGLGETSKKN